jgi:hypothetical protein
MVLLWMAWLGATHAVESEAPVAGLPSALEADSMRLESGIIWAENGRITDDAGVLFFESGQIVLDGGALDMEGVEIALESGWYLRAQRMRGVLNGVSTFEGATITACDCDCPVWALEATTLKITGPDTGEIEGASFDFGPLSLPLPNGRVPLAPKRFGVGLPGVGWELGQAQVDLPLSFRFRPGVKLELRPGWWQGPRLAGQFLVDDSTEVSGALEWGQQFGAITQFRHTWGTDRVGTAARGIWVDRAESMGRASDYLTRQLPFRDQVARLWAGPLQAEAWSWQGETSGSRVQLEWVDPLWTLGPILGDHAVATGWMSGRWRSEARVGLGAVDAWGPLEMRIQADVRALDLDLEEQAVDALGLVEGGLTFWAKRGAWRNEIRLGAKVEQAQRVVDRMTVLSALDEAPDVSGIGPQIQSQWWGPGYGRLEAWVPLSAEGVSAWSLVGHLQNENGGIAIQSQVQDKKGLHGVSFSQSGEMGSFWLGLMGVGVEASSLEPVLNAGGRLGLAFRESTLWPSATVIVANEEIAVLSAGIHLESNCDCFLVGLDLAWAEDRDEVTVGIAFDLLPRETQ